jgi:hypothetical protein
LSSFSLVPCPFSLRCVARYTAPGFQTTAPVIVWNLSRSYSREKRGYLRGSCGIPVALRMDVRSLRRPGSPLWCSAGATQLTNVACQLAQGESFDLPVLPCTEECFWPDYNVVRGAGAAGISSGRRRRSRA